uniref:hypothetical protein n=1 Tax=uncultured Dysgonomonas sp. TaxID=206096 RepID=UPI00262F7E78
WTKGLRSNTVEYPLFDLDNRKGSQVYHYTSAQSKLLYSSPSYNGSILDIQAAINISKFHAAKTVHPMQSDLFIEFVGDEPEDEEKQEFEDGIKRKFTGLNNAGNSIMIGYVKSRDEATRIEAIPTSDPEGKRFLQLREEVKASIITGHQLPSTELLAIANTKTLAFDSGYDKAYEIFQAVFVRPLQEELMKPINRLLSINFPGTKLELLPLPVVKVNLTNEQFIYENMTTEEVRADLLKAGRIDKAEYEPGSLNKEQNGKEPGSIDQAIISTIKKTKEDAA